MYTQMYLLKCCAGTPISFNNKQIDYLERSILKDNTTEKCYKVDSERTNQSTNRLLNCFTNDAVELIAIGFYGILKQMNA